MGVEVEGRLGVVVEVKVDLVAHFAGDAEIYLFVEVESEHFPVSLGQRGVVHLAHVGADFQFGGTLRLDLYAAGAEYLFRRTEVELHVGEVELVLAFGVVVLFLILLPVVGLHRAAHTPLLIFLLAQVEGGFEKGFAQLGAHLVRAGRFVVVHFRLQVLRVLEVGQAGVHVVLSARHGVPYACRRCVGRVGWRGSRSRPRRRCGRLCQQGQQRRGRQAGDDVGADKEQQRVAEEGTGGTFHRQRRAEAKAF